MRRTALVFVAVGVGAFAQVSSDIVKITHSGDKWYLQNLTKKVITAYVSHVGDEPLQVNLKLINCGPHELEWHPLQPGATDEITLKPGFEHVDIPAVIFEDGSVVGSAKTVEGRDVVDYIFGVRRAGAAEYARWLKIIEQSSHQQALADFRKEVGTPPVVDNLDDVTHTAVLGVTNDITGHLSELDHQDSEESAYTYLHAFLVGRVAFANKLALRRPR